MKAVDKEENLIAFTAEIEDSLANAIRRYVNEIPVIAIDEIEIRKNDSPLYDETVAHRVGLIPLKTEKIEGDKNKISLKLSVKGAGIVYSGELKGNANVVFDKIPITSLKDGQEVEFSATAKLGRGQEHAKFSPGLMFYRDICEISMDKSLADKIKKVCRNEIKEKGNNIIIIDDKRKEVCDVCEGIADKAGKKAEVNPTGELIIIVESFGQLTPKDIFKRAIETLEKDLVEVGKKISK